MKTIAIIGRDGTNARPWISAFLASGWQVRNLVRDPGKVASHRSLTAVAFNFEDYEAYEPALAGVDVFALISPAQPEQVEWETELIAAARKGGVGGIIRLSVIGADMAKPISFFARNAAEIERVLRASGVPHVILRANGFMQNLLRQRSSIEAGILVEPSGGAATSRIDVGDIAAVAVAVTKRPFDGDVLTLTGPVALPCSEMAATLSAVLKRPVRYISPPLAQFRAALSERGLPGWQVDAFVEVQEAILTGHAPHLAVVTNDVMRATGRPPRSFAQFAVREFGSAAQHSLNVSRSTPTFWSMPRMPAKDANANSPPTSSRSRSRSMVFWRCRSLVGDPITTDRPKRANKDTYFMKWSDRKAVEHRPTNQ